MAVELRPLQSFGVEVVGLDLSGPVPDSVKAQVRAAWLEHGVVLFGASALMPRSSWSCRSGSAICSRTRTITRSSP